MTSGPVYVLKSVRITSSLRPLTGRYSASLRPLTDRYSASKPIRCYLTRRRARNNN